MGIKICILKILRIKNKNFILTSKIENPSLLDWVKHIVGLTDNIGFVTSAYKIM